SGPEYLDIADNGKKKEVKAFTFHRMETEEVCKCYITSCFVERLEAYDGVTDLEYKKNLISNEFAVKLGLQYEVKKNGEKVVNRKLLVALKGELYFVGFVINLEEDDVEPGVIFRRSFLKLKHTREDMEEDLYERIMLLNKRRPIIKTLKYDDKHKKLLDSVLLDKLKLDGEFELKDEMVGEELIRGYKAIKEKGDPGVFVVTTILADFMLLDVPVDRDVAIIVGRSFLYTCGDIINTIRGTMSTFDGLVHQQFNVAKVRYVHVKSDSDDDEYYFLKMDDLGKPCYRPNPVSFLGALPVPIKNTKWAPNYSRNNTKEDGDRKWHAKIRVMDPYGNVFEQGYETKETDRKMLGRYK
nr:hypothetical protein [Tanacetum cinerariifolium]